MNKLNQVITKDNSARKYYSLKGNYWSQKTFNKNKFVCLQKSLNNESLLLNLLSSRDVPSEKINDFLEPKLKNLLPDPDVIDDMAKATNKIYDFIINKRKIGIFGDYDVDGSSATAIICNYLKSIGASYEFYIPDRISEGYGPSIGAFKTLQKKFCNLILTLDCGTSSIEAIEFAKKNEIEVIVIDHHLEGDKLPNAFAIVNPNKKGDQSKLNNLCAAGVAFFLIISINRKLKNKNFFQTKKPPNLLSFLDLVALGTVCDMVKLDLVNRVLVKQGLKIMNMLYNSGIKSLVDSSSIKDEINEYHLGFVLGPRINAAGRVGDSKLGARLLIDSENNLNAAISEKLNDYNYLRRQVEQKVENQAISQVNANNKNIICVHNDKWHPGVIGIVAGKLTELYRRPAIVISECADLCKASCRSVKNFHIGDFIIDGVKRGILVSGGGHEMAGGFSILKNNIENFKEYIKDKFILSNTNFEKNYDLEIKLSSVNLEFYDSIAKLEPYGIGNPKPKFLIKNCLKDFVKPAAKDHLIVNLSDIYGNSVKSIVFNAFKTKIGDFLNNDYEKQFDIICTLQLNKWSGYANVEIIIEDVLD